jgi:high-affinity nickel-transport protein
MKVRIASPSGNSPSRSRAQTISICIVLVAANVGLWLWALVALHDAPALLGTALLAYSLGLRHAFDADHIAAIDNATRKLMHQGKRPVAAGLFFSLGHSTVVVGLSVAVALGTAALQDEFDLFKSIGGAISTVASSLFLFFIAGANIAVFSAVYRTFQTVRSGGHLAEDDLELILANQGFLARIFRGLFRLVEHSWQMYPLGLLFGIGFDTASEVALLGISATQAAHGISVWSILVFPALFTAGMTLMDTAESFFMVRVYGWAFINPIRKVYYNLITTAMSITVAAVVGGLQTLYLIGDRLGLISGGGFWVAISDLNNNFGTLGALIVGVFIAAWLLSYVAYRLTRHDDVGTSPTRALPARQSTS